MQSIISILIFYKILNAPKYGILEHSKDIKNQYFTRVKVVVLTILLFKILFSIIISGDLNSPSRFKDAFSGLEISLYPSLIKLLKWTAIAGNILFMLWVSYNAMHERFQGPLWEKLSYVGLMGLLIINCILLLRNRHD